MEKSVYLGYFTRWNPHMGGGSSEICIVTNLSQIKDNSMEQLELTFHSDIYQKSLPTFYSLQQKLWFCPNI